MKEVLELRINNTFSTLLPTSIVGDDSGPVTKIKIETGTPEFQSVKEIAEKVKKEHTESFFYGWSIKRNYNKKEIEHAALFHLIISNVFEPAGEECGTLYDETADCEICGSNRKQLTPLTLKQNSIPKKDISQTIAGEIVISEKFVIACQQRGLKGLITNPIVFNKGNSNFFQLIASSQAELSQKTIAGINPFDLSISNEGEIYKCPKGHTIGLNLLSEPYLLNSPSIKEYDFFESVQKTGIKRGLLRPAPIYFCSPAFKKMIDEEKLTGFAFEVAHID
ncbi:MAG: hypothetical protein J7621_19660 [Niastella sp.]|nr:hypothetical protein [Niastella sp.]